MFDSVWLQGLDGGPGVGSGEGVEHSAVVDEIFISNTLMNQVQSTFTWFTDIFCYFHNSRS